MRSCEELATHPLGGTQEVGHELGPLDGAGAIGVELAELTLDEALRKSAVEVSREVGREVGRPAGGQLKVKRATER